MPDVRLRKEHVLSSGADEIVGLYERHAHAWDSDRRSDPVIEREWLKRFVALLPAGSPVLDIGCGSGQPIGKYLIEHGFNVVGVDSSPTLILKCRTRFPDHEWIVSDMRTMSLNRRFQGLVAWDSFFHLSHEHQRGMFTIFSKHAARGAPLLFTTGTGHGEATGSYQGEPLYHASLSPTEYRELLDSCGFSVVEHAVEDPRCGRHTVWLAQSVLPQDETASGAEPTAARDRAKSAARDR
jgi:SAM-dependent methyltransferase